MNHLIIVCYLTDNAGVCAPIISEKSGKLSNYPQLSPELASILEAAMLNLHYYKVILL